MHNNIKNWEKREEKFAAEEGLPFHGFLSEEEIKRALEKENVKYRKRIFTPTITIWAMLSQIRDGDCSYRKTAGRVLAFLVGQGEKVFSVTASAYCHAKARLKTEVLAGLAISAGEETSRLAKKEHLWCDRVVKTFDGSSLQMQDTKKNLAKYSKSKNQKGTCGFPIARWVVLFCLSTGAVLEMYIEPMSVSERVLFRRLYKNLCDGDVVLADRGACSFYDMSLLMGSDLNIDAVFRMSVNRKVNFRYGTRLGKKDHIVEWSKPQFRPNRTHLLNREQYDNLPDKIRVREVEVTLDKPGFRSKNIIVVTTLLSHKIYTRNDIALLYLRRWEAEVNLRHLKTTLKMDLLKSKTPEMAHKEVWAHVLLYNLIRRVMFRVAVFHCTAPLRISFKGTLDYINVFLIQLSCCNDYYIKQALFRILLWTISQDLLPKREGRIYQRSLKRRPKAYPSLMQSREQYRINILGT